MLTRTLKSSIQIRIADGGYILQWIEPKAPPTKAPEAEEDHKPDYLKDEERRFPQGFRPGWYVNPNVLESKVAVRVDLAAALELAGQVLGRLEKLEKDHAGP